MKDTLDPKGLIRESFAIEGIQVSECRSIFLDWALGVPLGQDTKPLIEALLARYADRADHPMTGVLESGLTAQSAGGRRGGRAARLRQN